MSTHIAPETVVERLEQAHIQYELVPHRRTDTALAEAGALGVEPQEVAKTIVLSTPDGFVRAVIPASERLDLRKVRAVLDTKDVHLATEETLAGAYPDFELGAVPPIGGAAGDRVIVDLQLGGVEFVFVEAGTHDRSLKLKTADLIALDETLLADICTD